MLNVGKPKSSFTTNTISEYTPITLDEIITDFTPHYDMLPVTDIQYIDSIVYKTNPTNVKLLKLYNESLNKLALYEEAIKINTYNEKFEDSLQIINVKTVVRGKMLKQSITTVLKPRIIPHYTTTITNTETIIDQSKLFFGATAYIPTVPDQQFSYSLDVMYKAPNQNVWKLGFDNNKNVNIGYYINLF
jgi:hypothetical protein